MDHPVNVGVIGFGYWGPNLVRNFNANAKSRVLAICDAQPERVALAERQYPGIPATSDYGELLADDRIDLIACATPTNSHFRLGKAALEAGKHVLLEKPMASTSGEAAELLRIAAARGRQIFVDHTYVFTPAVQKMKAMLREGQLGRLYYYDSTRINLGLYQSDVDVLWDLAPHDLSILDFLLDGAVPDSLSCSGVSHFGKHADQAYISLNYPDKFLAHVHVNWLAPVKARQVLLCADKHMLVYDELSAEKLRIYDRGVEVRKADNIYQHLVEYREGDMWAPHLENREALALEVNNILDTLQSRAEPVVDGYRGYRVVQLLEALTRSLSDGGRVVEVGADPPASLALSC